MRALLDIVTRLDAGDIFSGGALVTLFCLAILGVVKGVQGLCQIYNNFSDIRAQAHNPKEK